MACQGLRVILDTSVFVFWYNRYDNYLEIMKCIREEGFKLVLCEGLRREYLANLFGRSTSNYYLLQRELEKLRMEQILEYANPKNNNSVVIHEDDQHVLDCALTEDCHVHMIVTDNTSHFQSKSVKYNLPLIISSKEFQEKNTCHTFCSEAKRICQKIIEIGEKVRYS
ncbi:MAG: PIN domain-containing protein [Candidatus Thorarchaeota archaeon]|nr:PIN domain-containing protein [Candidatus Thorarchaeota archaeon]